MTAGETGSRCFVLDTLEKICHIGAVGFTLGDRVQSGVAGILISF
jgi:hypothetical protein